jgi:hypothetical protein
MRRSADERGVLAWQVALAAPDVASRHVESKTPLQMLKELGG